ncbi:MAG: LysR family transcriptional regulator [Candidatus Omnitrophica bacterium]|nr:LysR family transcriptional regulator [Candidatus Omnitrophota bacterium]
MEIRQLKIFRDIAHEKSFVKTAKLNFLTQPSISTHLKHLEEDLGVKLFDRAPRRVTLTKEGSLLLPYVEDLLIHCENLKLRVAEARQIPRGDIRIATIYSVGMYELAPFLKKFIRTYPEIHVHLQYRRADIVYDLVLKNKIDVGIAAYPEVRAKIKVTPFGSDRLVLIVPPHHPFAKRRRIRLERIQGESFIAFDRGIPTREAIDRVLDQMGIKVEIRMSNDNVDTLKRAVEVGLGISIVPSKTVMEEVRKGTLKSIHIDRVKLNRPLGILTLKERVLGNSVQLFIRMLTAKRRGSDSTQEI